MMMAASGAMIARILKGALAAGCMVTVPDVICLLPLSPASSQIECLANKGRSSVAPGVAHQLA
jgi:hypothetical protein